MTRILNDPLFQKNIKTGKIEQNVDFKIRKRDLKFSRLNDQNQLREENKRQNSFEEEQKENFFENPFSQS